uniref:Translocation and assembly module TamB C-terminal domain-containing protein n=1 Tax=Gracilinema caldarium TaxID=215591 RepID=A0A7C3EC20_9SPIR
MVPISKSKSIKLELSLFALGLVLMVFLSTLVKKELMQASKYIQDSLIARVENSFDIKLTYGSLGPSLFATIDIRNIKIRSQDDGHLILQVDRFRLGYSLWKVLQGNFAESFRSLRIEKPILVLDTEQDQALLQKFTGSAGIAGEGGTVVAQPDGSTIFTDLLSSFNLKKNIQFRLLKGEFSFTDGKTQYSIRHVNLTGSVLKDEFTLKSKLDLVLDMPGIFPEKLASTLEMQGSFALNTLSGSFKTALSQLNTPLFSAKKFGFQTVFTKDKLDIYKIKDFLPYTFSLSYTFKDQHLQGSLEFADFSPRVLLETSGSLSNLSPWLTTSISGTAQCNYYLGKDITYGAALRATIPVPWKDTKAELSLKGTGSNLDISSLSLASDRGTIQYAGSVNLNNLSINGNIALIRVLSPTNIPIDATFTVTTRGAERGADYYLFGESLSVGAVLFSAVDAHITVGRDSYTWDLSALQFINVESYENVRVARVFSDGVYDPALNLVQGSLRLDSLDLASVATLARAFISGFPDIPKSSVEAWTMTTEIFLSSDSKHISYSSPRLILTNQDETSATIIASIAGTERQISIQNGQLLMKNLGAHFSGQADFSDIQDITIDANLVYENVAYAIQVGILDFNTITLKGSYGLAGSFLRSEDGFWSGYCKADTLPVPVNANRVLLSFDAGFKFFDADNWGIDLRSLELRDIPGFTKLPVSISCAGKVNPLGIALSEVQYDDGGGTLRGKFTAAWQRNFSNLTMSARLADTLNSERYEIDLKGSLSGEAEGRLYMARANLDRFYPTGYTPIVTGEARFNWASDEQFAIDWKIASLQFRLFDQDVLVVSSGNLSPDTFELFKSSITFGSLQADIDTLQLSRISKSVFLSSRLRGVLSSSSLDIYNDVKVQFSNLPKYSELIQQLPSLNFQGTFALTKGFYDTWTIGEPLTFSFSKTGQGFSLRGGPQDAVRTEWTSDGAFYAAFAQPLPLRGSITGSIAQGFIDANANNLYIDVSALWNLLPQGLPLRITSGFGLANLSIRGPVSDPSFYGSATASSVRMVVPDWLQDELGPVNLSFIFNENTIQLAKVLIPAGKGQITAEGTMNFERWLPGNFDFTASIAENTPLHYKSNIVGLNAKGKSFGTLGLSFQDGAFSLQGNLEILDTLITYSGIPQNENVNIDKSINFKSRINLKTGKKVEFVWPNTNFPVMRAYTDVGSLMQIRSDSETGKFSVNGAINLRGGEVFYFQRSFYIRSGQLVFNENELRFDPQIALRAELRDRTSTGPVTISLIIDNAPLSKFNPRFISEPPLSQIDIFALLGQNVLGSSNSPAGSSLQDAVLNASSDILAQFNVVRVFEQNIRDTLNLDMFSIRTQVFQNALLQASGILDTPVDRTASLGNYFDNTTLYLGKYFGPDFFVQSMVSLRYDPENQNSLSGGLIVEPEIGAELRSPLFTINWNFVPKTGDRLFINSQSVTISWKWSF